ncbi:MAG: hypothetical protein ACJ75H_23290 [Thermoanaerobaculia bacterium]
MNRFRSSLLLLAVVALLLAAVPAFAAEAAQCPAPAQASTLDGLTPAPTFMIRPPVDYVLCSCSLCKSQPDIDCQISPSGYSIMCSDWYRMHC